MRASRSNRASRSASAAKPSRQDLDRDLAAQPRVARAIHLAHAAFAEELLQLVDADAAAGPRGGVRRLDQRRGDLDGRFVEEPRTGGLIEEGVHFAEQIGVAAAGARHECQAFCRRTIESGMEDPLDGRPASGSS